MTVAQLRYAGALPTGSATVVLMDTTALAAGVKLNPGPLGYKKLRVAFRNDEAGTVTLDKLLEDGTWAQVAEAAVAASTDADISEYEFMIHQYKGFRLEWENGGVSQTVFNADMVMDDEVGAPT